MRKYLQWPEISIMTCDGAVVYHADLNSHSYSFQSRFSARRGKKRKKLVISNFC